MGDVMPSMPIRRFKLESALLARQPREVTLAIAADTHKGYVFKPGETPGTGQWSRITEASQLAAVEGKIGKLQTATGALYGCWPFAFTATTDSSGVATVSLTNPDDSAAFAEIVQRSVSPIGIGSANYNVTDITISPDRKTMTITLNQIKMVLGVLSYSATADEGITVQGTVWGR